MVREYLRAGSIDRPLNAPPTYDDAMKDVNEAFSYDEEDCPPPTYSPLPQVQCNTGHLLVIISFIIFYHFFTLLFNLFSLFHSKLISLSIIVSICNDFLKEGEEQCNTFYPHEAGAVSTSISQVSICTLYNSSKAPGK